LLSYLYWAFFRPPWTALGRLKAAPTTEVPMRRYVIALAIVVLSIGLDAKGPTIKLTITGPGLAAPIEIVEPAILEASNIFAGSFVGETVTSTPVITQPMYTVTFDLQPPQNKPVRTAYAVSVARDARSGALWLYLPGRGEAGYALNVGTILRDGQDGHWHRPSQAWAAAIGKNVP
jgi:hypothetical protein